jgi:hypothetical protein
MLCDLTGLCDGFLHTGPVLDLQLHTETDDTPTQPTHGELPNQPTPHDMHTIPQMTRQDEE